MRGMFVGEFIPMDDEEASRTEQAESELKTVTTAIRRDLWKQLNLLAVEEECTIQSLMNRAVWHLLKGEGRTVGQEPK
jgi:hypothetical protein